MPQTMPARGDKKAAKKKSTTAKGMNNSQFIDAVATKSGLTKAQVKAAFEAQAVVIASEIKSKHPVTIPGLVKIKLVHKEATPARPGINPFTKQPITVKAKPARDAIKVRPLKKLKDMA
jgi:nucleoid DNA-binding protein